VGHLEHRLDTKIDVEANTGCWLWNAATDKQGYGTYHHERRMVVAHRVVYEALVGPIPEGMEIDHLCRVVSCVNPDHLEPVTHAENMGRGANTGRRKTHCVNGHEFTGDNLSFYKRDGAQRCRTCARAATQRQGGQ